MLKTKHTALILVDVQEKLLRVMGQRQRLIEQLEKLVRGIQALDVDILWCEQMPEKLGATVEPLAGRLDGLKPISKSTFSCANSKKFIKQLDQVSPKQILLAGIETHVCVYQTAMQLAEIGYETQVVADAVSSRNEENHRIALRRMTQEEVKLTTVEMALMELVKDADSNKFEKILPIIK